MWHSYHRTGNIGVLPHKALLPLLQQFYLLQMTREGSFSSAKYCSHSVFLPLYHSTFLFRLRLVISKIHHRSSFFFFSCFLLTLSVRSLFGLFLSIHTMPFSLSFPCNVFVALFITFPFPPPYIPLTRQTTVSVCNIYGYSK